MLARLEFGDVPSQRGHAVKGNEDENNLLSITGKWIRILGRGTEIRWALINCVQCRRCVSSVRGQPVAAFAKCRVKPSWWPSSGIEIDYFGPSWVRCGNGQNNDRNPWCYAWNLKPYTLKLHTLWERLGTFRLQRFTYRLSWPSNVHSDKAWNLVAADQAHLHWDYGVKQGIFKIRKWISECSRTSTRRKPIMEVEYWKVWSHPLELQCCHCLNNKDLTKNFRVD